MKKQKKISIIILLALILGSINLNLLSEGKIYAESNSEYELVIPAIYDSVGDFSEGLALVEIDGKCGYIDKTGELIIPAIYEYVADFSEGLGSVKINGKWGYIDKTGNLAIQPQFDDAWNFSEGLAKVEIDGKWGYIDKTGKFIIHPQVYKDGFSEVEINSKYGYVNGKGYFVIQPQFDNPVAITYNDILYVTENIPEKFSHTYISNLGYYIKYFSEGLAEVEVDGKWGYIDKTGKLVIPAIYNSADAFSEGLAAVSIDGKCGYIDKTGNLAIQPQFDHVQSFSEGIALAVINDKFGCIDKTGDFVSPPIYEYVDDFSEGLARVKIDDKYGYIDKTGKLVIPAIYGDIHDHLDREIFLAGNFSEGLAAVEIDGKCGYIDKIGKLVTPAIYDSTEPLTERGLGRVSIDGKYGYIDKTGNLVIPAIYDEAEYFFEKSSEIKINDKIGYIDKTGKLVIPAIYGYIDDFSEGLAIVSIDGKYGYIDKTGTLVIPDIYDSADAFSEGLAAVKINGKWGYIGKPNSSINSSQPQKNLLSEDELKNNEIKISNSAIKYIDITDRQADINQQLILDLIEKAKQEKEAIEKNFKKDNIKLPRDIMSAININLNNFDDSVSIPLNKNIFKNVNDIDLININTDSVKLGLKTKTIQDQFKGSEIITIKITKNKSEFGQEYVIQFILNDGTVISSLPCNIKLTLPTVNNNPTTNAIYFNDKDSIEVVGGQYNKEKDGIEIETKQSGTYYVLDNPKSFNDIGSLNSENQQAIKFLASKGIIGGKSEGKFEPNGNLTRAEFVKLLVRAFYVLDNNADMDFSDVSVNDWYYTYVASATNENLVGGFPDGTFKPNDLITKEQMIAVCSRSLHERKKYIYPSNPEKYLENISDNGNIQDWAKKEVSLAVRENIAIVENGKINPNKPVTRSEAALILYKLFMKLY